MAGELTRHETELFYDISTDIEQYDPGLDEFNFIMKRAELFINTNGGTESLNYFPTLAQLNDQWEFHDHPAKLSGRLYVNDKGIVEVSPGEWRGPFADTQGTYFIVEGATLVSCGIIDAGVHDPNRVSADGTIDESARLAYGFNPPDIDSEVPLFYAAPDDLLHAEYDMPTMDAVATRLRRLMPEEIERLDKRIYKSGFDPMKLVKKLRKSVSEMRPQLVKNQELQELIGRYIYERMELDTSWSYGVTLEGRAAYAEDDDPLRPIVFQGESLHYLRAVGLSFEESTEPSGRRVALSIIFAVPTAATEGEGIDGRLFVPLETIKGMFSTRPMGSIHQSFLAAIDRRSDESIPGDADISLPEPAPERPLHPRVMEYKRLEAFESLITVMKSKVAAVRRTRHSTPQDALYVANNLSKWFNESVMELQLVGSDVIRVSGPGVIKSNASLRRSERVFSIEIDEENPIVSPTPATDIMGVYEGMIAEVDKYEAEDGTDFWLPAPKLTMALQMIQEPLVTANYPLLSAGIKSSAVARLDDMTQFELPELDRMRARHQALTAVATEQRSGNGLRQLRAIDRAFYHESPDTWNEAGTMLKHLRRLAGELTEKPDDTMIEALRQQMLGRRVQLTGDTWFGSGRSDDHFNVGIINDLFVATLPDGTEELVVNVAGTTSGGDTNPVPDAAALVVLRTVSHLKF